MRILRLGVDLPVEGELNIWDFQLIKNPEVVASIQAAKEGTVTNKLFARKLKVVEVDEVTAENFFNKNHLAGFCRYFKFGIGLCDKNGELAMCAAFTSSRFSRETNFELARFCSKLNTVVAGGLSKLIGTFKRTYPDAMLLAYSDDMLGNGKAFEQAGFTFGGKTKPAYLWCKDEEVLTKYDVSASKLKLKYPGHVGLSETAIMKLHGFQRIQCLAYSRWFLNPKEVTHEFNYFYKIERTDGAFYFGIHSTDNLEDGYFGSGVKLRNSIQSYGLQNHVKTNLEFFTSRKAALAKEAQVVTKELLTDEKCLNVALGGGTSFSASTAGSRMMFKDGVQTLVMAEDIEAFLAAGFKFGRIDNNNKDLIWIKTENGDRRVHISQLSPNSVLGRSVATTKGRVWVQRAGVQQLVNEVLPTDEKKFIQITTNLGKKRLIDPTGTETIVTAEEVPHLLAQGWTKPKPPLEGKIGMRSPEGIKKVVPPQEARELAKLGWVIATKQLKSAPPQVLELAAELGMKLPRKRKLQLS